MWFLSREWRLNNLYKIIDKKGDEVTFRMNAGQKRLFEKENELRKTKGKVWLKLLKARQIGFTTYKTIDKLDKALTTKNCTVNIVAHKQDKLQDIFMKVKYTFDRIPDIIELEDGRKRHKPKPKYDNRNEYYFPELNSKIKITLDSRSGTLTDCHVSEWAFIKDFRDMLRATIPAAEQADITVETTANGMNEFKDFWDNDDRFETMFFPRFEQSEYQEQAPEWYVVMEELRYLQERYKLTNNQLYRYETRYKNDKDGTLQEYPSEPIDAFISSWSPFYDLQTLRDYKVNNNYIEDENIKWLKRYRKEKNNDAIIWIDFAEWLDHWDKTTVRIRTRDLKLIATYRGVIEPWEVCWIIEYLYNNWIEWVIAPERNNHWHTFLFAAKQYRWYKDIYIPKWDKNDIDDLKFWQRGWLTNMVTRPLMLDEHKKSITDKILEMDEELKSECYTFIKKNWKPQADENCFDDVVMWDAICLQMTKEKKVLPSSQKAFNTSLDHLL
jgi:hypothetical protein